jgi:hypothetical protein
VGVVKGKLSYAGLIRLKRYIPYSAYTLNLKVNRNRLKECMEAWVYVNIASTIDDEGHIIVNGWDFSYFRTVEGVLTWQNSD